MARLEVRSRAPRRRKSSFPSLRPRSPAPATSPNPPSARLAERALVKRRAGARRPGGPHTCARAAPSNTPRRDGESPACVCEPSDGRPASSNDRMCLSQVLHRFVAVPSTPSSQSSRLPRARPHGERKTHSPLTPLLLARAQVRAPHAALFLSCVRTARRGDDARGARSRRAPRRWRKARRSPSPRRN